MMDFDKYNDQIFDYLFNEMTDLEREAFEHRIKEDPGLAAEVELQKEMFAEIKARLVYKEMLDDPHREEIERLAEEAIARRDTQDSSSRVFTKRKIITRLFLNAAAILLLFILNQVTMRITPIHGLLQKSLKSFKALWKLRK